MFKSYQDGKFAVGLILGLTIATLCFLWVFSVNYCPDAPCHYQNPPDQSETYSQRWFPIPWNPNSTLQPKPITTESAPSDHEYYDLVAQENMARATNVIAWATIVTVFTSIVGVWLLVSNLSVVAEGNEIMRQDQRPWILFEKIDVDIRNIIDEISGIGTPGIVIRASVKNHGNSIALDVRSTTKFFLAMTEMYQFSSPLRSLMVL